MSRTIIFILVLSSIVLYIHADFEVYYWNYTYNPIPISNLTIDIHTPYYGSLNFSYDLKCWFQREIKKETISFEILVPKDKRKDTFDTSVVRTTVNLCKFGDALSSNTLLTKLQMDKIFKCNQFEIKCPFKVGLYRSFCYVPDMCQGYCLKAPGWLPIGKFLVKIRIAGAYGNLKRNALLYEILIFMKYKK